MSRFLTLAPLAAAGVLFAAAPTASAAFVLNDFDTAPPAVGVAPAGGSSAAVVDAPDADDDNELRVVSGTSANFAQFVKIGGIGRTGPVIDALAGGKSIDLTLLAFDADLTQGFNVGFVVNTNAWTTDPATTYRRVAQTNVPDGTDTTKGLSFDHEGNAAFRGALSNYAAGGGTFFEFFLDNTGFPSIAAPQTFYVDDLLVQPVPEPGAVAVVAVAGLALTMRRTRRGRN
jgi:hypothetical protein